MYAPYFEKKALLVIASVLSLSVRHIVAFFSHFIELNSRFVKFAKRVKQRHLELELPVVPIQAIKKSMKLGEITSMNLQLKSMLGQSPNSLPRLTQKKLHVSHTALRIFFHGKFIDSIHSNSSLHNAH